MPTRSRSATKTPTSGFTRRRHLASAATMLPLAIGLAGHLHSRPAPSAPQTIGAASISCTLPFDPIKQHHPIDDSCTADGAAPPDSPQSHQNDAKNNFCATGVPINVDFEVLRQLQKDVEASGISFGSDPQLPADRSLLRNFPTKAGLLSEGMVVRLAAFVIDAHYSNVGKGESVNCKQPDKESNDIHIVLADNGKEQDECNSVTAEMSPHFRPDVWDPTNLNQHNAHIYRFTGQLFFDASHRPCAGGKGSPKRSSLWEVHPVYGVDICVDPNNNCKVDSDQNWVSFAEQMGVDPSETRLWLPDDIANEFDARLARYKPKIHDE